MAIHGARVLCCVGLGIGLASVAQADWPEILGPQRNGHTTLSVPFADHADAPPKVRWELAAGQGYAGAAIEAGQVALFDRDGSEDVLRLVSLDDGSPVWSVRFPATYGRGIDPDNGPRCVPQLTKDLVLAYSAGGVLHCVNRADGTKRWSRALRREFGAEDGYFGAGSAPLIVGNSVIVCVGGRKGAGIVAVNLADGKNLWQSTDSDASYASPILIDSTVRPGLKTVVAPTRLVTYGLDPRTGEVRWQFPFGQRGPTVVAATPIEIGQGRLFLTASYGIGQLIVKPDPQSVRMLEKGDAISSQYATPVAIDKWIFGCDGRSDSGGGSYRCLSSDDGKEIWSETGMPICHTIALDPDGNNPSLNATAPMSGRPHLLLVGEDGRLWYLPATSNGFEPYWKTTLPTGLYRALPALSKNLLVVRTSGGSNFKWYCLEL
jgi:outer membrane protein assembly factor BamB